MSLFGGYIDEVQHVFRDNNLDFGSPFDFRIFAKSLKKDPVLREDLAVLTRSIMERENNISLRTVLNILAIASGGPDLDTSDSDMSQPVNLLSDFLLNVTGGSQTIVQDSDVPDFKPIEELSPQVVLLASSSSDLETPDDDQSTLEAVTPRPDDDQIGQLPQPPQLDQLPPSPSANPYAESLTRLELNSLQVKHYLDSIDQRISRIEPRLDGLPAYPAPLAMHQSNLAAGGKYSAVMASEMHADPPQDESRPPELPPAPANKSAEVLSDLGKDLDQDPSGVQLAIPVIAGIGAVAVVLISLLYWTFQREVPSRTIHSATPPLADNAATPPPNRAPATSEYPSSPSENATPSQSQSHAVATKNPSATVDRSSGTSTPIHHRASSPASGTVNGQPRTQPATTPVVASTATDLPTSAAPLEGLDTSSSSISSTPRIHVSSGMMTANVLSAPQPAYPKLALLTHMQGEVVMQAIISTDGTIENVRVLKGHRLLRGAATSAVRTWRYRPVVVDGRPVEVATIVTVTFTLP